MCNVENSGQWIFDIGKIHLSFRHPLLTSTSDISNKYLQTKILHSLAMMLPHSPRVIKSMHPISAISKCKHVISRDLISNEYQCIIIESVSIYKILKK
jgi:hypothetical protein